MRRVGACAFVPAIHRPPLWVSAAAGRRGPCLLASSNHRVRAGVVVVIVHGEYRHGLVGFTVKHNLQSRLIAHSSPHATLTGASAWSLDANLRTPRCAPRLETIFLSQQHPQTRRPWHPPCRPPLRRARERKRSSHTANCRVFRHRAPVSSTTMRPPPNDLTNTHRLRPSHQ